MDTTPEQSVLKQSIVATALVGTSCIVFGLWIVSQSIVFDGVYSLFDVVLTLGSLAVSRLVGRDGSRRFQYGYWHLEPLVLTFNSAMLSLLCVYALINGIEGLRGEGHVIAFEGGMVWVVAIGAICIGLWLYIGRRARQLGSDLLRLDAKGWLVSGGLNVALLLAFALGAMARNTEFAAAGRYADSLVLVLLAIVMLPMPIASFVHALREVLQIAPADLDRRVRDVLDRVNTEHGCRLPQLRRADRSHRARRGALQGAARSSDRQHPRARCGARRDRAALGEPHVWLTVNFAGCDVEPLARAAEAT